VIGVCRAARIRPASPASPSAHLTARAAARKQRKRGCRARMSAGTTRASAREVVGREKAVEVVVAVRGWLRVCLSAYACVNGQEQQRHQQTAAIGCPRASSNNHDRSCPADADAAFPCSESNAGRSARRQANLLHPCAGQNQR